MKKKMVALLLAVMVTSTSLMQVPVVAHAEENQTEVSLMEEEQSEAAEEGTDQPEAEEPTPDEAEEPVVTTPEETEKVETTETPEVTEEAIAPQAAEEEVEVQAEKTKISYRTHVQTYGWQDFVSNGEMSGTEGQSKRLEGIEIKLENQEYDGGIRYKTHVQTYGWQNFVSNGEMSGTEGQSKRLEAIQMELTGEMANHYDIYYRVHCQTYGWMGWAKNGQLAGTAGYSKRLEGIEICLVSKGAAAPGKTDGAYTEPHTHTWVEITREEPVVEEMVACEVCNDCNLNMTKKWLDEKGDYLKWYNSGNTYEGKNTLVAYLRSTAEEREDSTFDHMETHRYTGKGSWRTEYVTLDTGLTKTVVTGYKCSGCGATK